MQLKDFLASNAILPSVKVANKKQLFQEISASRSDIRIGGA